MTASRERSFEPERTARSAQDHGRRPPGGQQAGDEQATRPDLGAVKNELERQVAALEERFGEADIGGPWHPGEVGGIHTTGELKSVGDGFRLTGELGRLSVSEQILALLYLGKKCEDLWDESLAYWTLEAVQEAAAKFVGGDPATGARPPQQGWERDALRAAGQAIRLTTADMAVFKQINLSSAEGLEEAADSSRTTTELITEMVRPPLAALGPRPAEPSDRIAEGLRKIENMAQKNRILYEALGHAAAALIEFENWLGSAPRLGSRQSPPASGSSGPRHPQGQLLTSIGDSIGHVRRALASLRELIAYAFLRELIAKDSLTGLLPENSVSADSLTNLKEVIARSSLGDLIAAGSLGELIVHPALGEHIAGELADDKVLSRCEPWERLLTDVRDIVAVGDSGRVFVPRRVSIRYCYPFAIEADGNLRNLLDLGREPGEPLNELRGQLDQAFSAMKIKVDDLRELSPTELFAKGLYGGVRVDLPEVEFRFELPPGAHGGGRGGRCRVWIVLSHMGNHCLCIEPKPLDAPLPHLLYRALHIGTPTARGAMVFLAKPPEGTPGGTQVGWDNLQLFSQDVIRAIADMTFWRADETADDAARLDRFVRGNLHEIMVIRTGDPLGAHPEEIADALDRVVGGRIAVRSVQRTAATLEEWVRYPPVPRTGYRGLAPVIAGIPDMGQAGDWCAYTGETTVFGITAAPSWHTDVYMEAAQFASSWSPRLRLWSRRLEGTIEFLEEYTGEGGQAERSWREGKKRAVRLRRTERQIRLYLAQISTEELTATLAHRRFLDQLLEMAGLRRLEGDLQAQLEAAEKLTDWFNDRAHEESDSKRQVLLAVIALFGLFELGTFLGLANATKFHAKFLFLTVQQGIWEDWVLLALFVLGFAAGFYFFSERLATWVNKQLRAVARMITPGRPGKESRRLCLHEWSTGNPRPADRGRRQPHREDLPRDTRTVVQLRRARHAGVRPGRADRGRQL